MDYEISKSLTGTKTVKYQCPKCGTNLVSKLAEAGSRDLCPECKTSYEVPGTKDLELLRRKQKAEQEQKERAKQIADQQRALEKEAKQRQRQKRVSESQMSSNNVATPQKNTIGKTAKRGTTSRIVLLFIFGVIAVANLIVVDSVDVETRNYNFDRESVLYWQVFTGKVLQVSAPIIAFGVWVIVLGIVIIISYLGDIRNHLKDLRDIQFKAHVDDESN